jgi:hypothetical protein
MRQIPDIEWQFAGPDDEARYRTEVSKIWSAWLVALVALVFGTGWIVTIVGLVVLGVIVVLIRPLQQRAADLVPDDGSGADAAARDRALRDLVFSEAPLKVANSGPAWLWARRSVVVLTGLAVALAVYDLLTGMGSAVG